MQKIVIPQANLSLHMQEASEINDGKLHSGIISTQDDGQYLFEETAPSTVHPRNPKLYDGQYVTLVRMRNGRYQPHLKTLNITDDFDPQSFAFNVYAELINALKYVCNY